MHLSAFELYFLLDTIWNAVNCGNNDFNTDVTSTVDDYCKSKSQSLRNIALIINNQTKLTKLNLIELSKEINEKVILVTKDINMRIKADALDIPVEDYETDTVSIDELYKGYAEIIVNDEDYKKSSTTTATKTTTHVNYLLS